MKPKVRGIQSSPEFRESQGKEAQKQASIPLGFIRTLPRNECGRKFNLVLEELKLILEFCHP